MSTLAAIMLKRAMKQRVVYWAKAGSDPWGKSVYTQDSPIELPCRWEDKQQEIILPDGRKVQSRGYLLLVDNLLMGSLVLLGTLTVWQALPTYPEPPTVLQGGREVILVRTTPEYNNRSVLYQAYL